MIEAEEYSNIASRKKVKNFVGSLFFIVRVCLRFCEILKILTGQNNLSLKFTVVKKDIEKLMKKYPEWKIQDEKDDLLLIMPVYKQCLKSNQPFPKSKFCQWCFKELKK